MNKKELLHCVKESEDVRNSSIKFPDGIDLQENNHVITFTMQEGITKNMQDDSAAFEGWVLCLKASFDAEAMRCCLKWNKPADPKDKHYQRFLYRVERFNGIFGGSSGWFFVDDESKELMADLEIKDGEIYYLNSPSTRGDDRRNDATKNIESRLENEILAQQDDLKDLKKLCPVKLDRQLPVGLFHDEVKKANAIFPSKHSAIDLWGANGDDLYILELKAAENCKVGILSELFFYTMVLRDEQIGRFFRKSGEGESIRNTNQIKAFILAPELHPFITKKVFLLINDKSKNQKIEFGYVEIKDKPQFQFERKF